MAAQEQRAGERAKDRKTSTKPKAKTLTGSAAVRPASAPGAGSKAASKK